MTINSVSLGLLVVLFVWIQVPFGVSKSIPQIVVNDANSNKAIVNATTGINATELKKNVTELSQSGEKSNLISKRIGHKKREADPDVGFSFDELHSPCDLDSSGRALLIEYFPAICKWMWNYRHVNEGYYRIFKTFQLEAFFFGQYYERLKRYEIDPHSFEYYNTHV
ncbi:uncharacterized protein LOC111518656 [Drosophila willistoni]|uniref:uncharacterized protein LOC111518656 n=1 Tax=Drosophila willistoni TaxID=7260 RepID=UPI000C26D1E3|nr:uncharacterized protein LOC111518656 [Drosophila willistoni]